MKRTIVMVVLAALLAGTCTSEAPPPQEPSPTGPSLPPTQGPGADPLVLDVVADVSPSIGSLEEPNTYVDGMRLAVQEVNAGGGVDGRLLNLAIRDHAGDPALAQQLIGDVLGREPTAILYVGPGTALTPHRLRFTELGLPAILLEGDLYTSRGLFPQVFQTTIPWEWQANVIARYVIRDRGATDITFGGAGPEAKKARDTMRDALEYWGGALSTSFTYPAGGSIPQAGLADAVESDWVVAYGSSVDAPALVNAIEEAARVKPGVTGSSGLLVASEGLAHPEPGTSVCSTYTWPGWAEPIPRVGRFRKRLEEFAGHLPQGHEQEGYAAVRALVLGLRQTGGRGGPDLTDAVEAIQGKTFSGFPTALGPDDHVFPPRDELGLLTVPGPGDELDPWLEGEDHPWMPLMRTFTYGGERTSVLDRDRRVFFPYWNKNLPGPKYWRSRYGITSRPKGDSLH